jgi:hypothetical protein
LTSGKEACEKLLKPPTFKQQLLAMEAKLVWAVQNMVAWVKAWLVNIAICKSLLVIFWMGVFLVPWALRASVSMLSLLEGLTGRELNFGDRRKGIR